MPSPCGIPSSFTQGDSVSFSYGDAAYPPSLWNLKLAVSNVGAATVFAATANADGINFDFVLSPAQTSALSPGKYITSLVAISTDATQRHTLARSCVTVAPDLTATFKSTPNMLLLASAQAAYQKLMGSANKTVDFNGQTFTKRDLGEFRKEIDRLQNIVNGELFALGLSTKGMPKRLVVQFGF